MIVGMARSLHRMEHLNCPAIRLALALLIDIKLGWKGLPEITL